MRYPLWSAMVLFVATAPLTTMAHSANAPSPDVEPAHASFTWRAWADSEYLADRDAGIDAARLCKKMGGKGRRPGKSRHAHAGQWQLARHNQGDLLDELVGLAPRFAVHVARRPAGLYRSLTAFEAMAASA